MKINIDELLDNTSPKELDGFFDNIEEPVDEESINRLQSKVFETCIKENAATGSCDLQSKTDKEHLHPRKHFSYKKWIGILTSAACLAFVFYLIKPDKDYYHAPVGKPAPATSDTNTDTDVSAHIDTDVPSSIDKDESVNLVELQEYYDSLFNEYCPDVHNLRDIHHKTEPEATFKLNVKADQEDMINEKPFALKDHLNGHFAYYGYTYNLLYHRNGTGKESFEGIRFFDSDNGTYVFLSEYEDLLKYQDGLFIHTDQFPVFNLCFAKGTYNNCAYVFGNYSNLANNYRGIFSFNLETHALEQCIRCKDTTVSSAIVTDTKIYYVTDNNIITDNSWKHTLKCADLMTGEITDIITDAPYLMTDLYYYNNELFFKADYSGQIRICHLSQDMTLYNMAGKYHSDYTISDNKIYNYYYEKVYSRDPIALTDTIYHIDEYDLNGEKTGEIIFSFYGTKYNTRPFFDTRIPNRITIYKGKAVVLDYTGFYLYDFNSDSKEKILDLDFTKFVTYNVDKKDYDHYIEYDYVTNKFKTKLHYYEGGIIYADYDGFFNSVSMDVYNNKLYIYVNGEVFNDDSTTSLHSCIYEYDGNEVKTIDTTKIPAIEP